MLDNAASPEASHLENASSLPTELMPVPMEPETMSELPERSSVSRSSSMQVHTCMGDVHMITRHGDANVHFRGWQTLAGGECRTIGIRVNKHCMHNWGAVDSFVDEHQVN